MRTSPFRTVKVPLSLRRSYRVDNQLFMFGRFFLFLRLHFLPVLEVGAVLTERADFPLPGCKRQAVHAP